MSSNVTVIYCFITNNPKFPGVNNNNLFYSQICILGKIRWKQIMFFFFTRCLLGQINYCRLELYEDSFLYLMLVESWNVSWSCLSELHMAAWYPYRILTGF